MVGGGGGVGVWVVLWDVSVRSNGELGRGLVGGVGEVERWWCVVGGVASGVALAPERAGFGCTVVREATRVTNGVSTEPTGWSGSKVASTVWWGGWW